MQAELPTSTELQAIKNLKQTAREECILPGTSICGGCGGGDPGMFVPRSSLEHLSRIPIDS